MIAQADSLELIVCEKCAMAEMLKQFWLKEQMRKRRESEEYHEAISAN
ncbi:hypothetical protein SAMN00768000_1293 [Sulfobacillus thermosulfidooxidans DSM 9293]|uniref:Uncharacterized protein n=1 Tax=Sulfobacillus thermosulfidooxidans (strain DSM 9293 / VKM B-1269 / AT-1) TaxID=929705 RepID=A0A1W1WCC0_SULTA|nr:hypothetical protein [Sulfobacillus thermosulfidooxidans]SMC03819.1 hypothetical protein SAMN00768000_1293 [Sulfobacillus thermosulfidooxidans DSM 9293]